MSVPTAKLVTTTGRPAVKRIIPDSSDDDDAPIAKRSKAGDKNAAEALKPAASDSESDDEPIASTLDKPGPQGNGRHSAASSSNLTETDHGSPTASSTNQLKRPSESSSGLTTSTAHSNSSNLKLPKINKKPVSKESHHTPCTISPVNKAARRLSLAKKIKTEDASSDDDQPIASQNVRLSTKKPRQTKSNSVIKPKMEDPDDASVIKGHPAAKKARKSAPDKVKIEAVDKKPDITLPANKPIKVKAKKNGKTAASAATANGNTKKKKAGKSDVKEEDEEKAQSEQEAEDAQYKWWEQVKDDDTKKWDTLHHNGVLFPPEYVPLPKYVKMKYNGAPVDLPPEAEEVAGFFGGMLNSDHCQKPTFCENFFNDFLEILRDHPPRDGTKIKEFSKCDFTPFFEYYDGEREKKKSLTKAEKLALKKEKEAMEEPYRFCMLDGRPEKVGNFRVEPPSLFRGRGEHPKTGRLKKRICAEEITINCSADASIPKPPEGHQWGAVVHLDRASWLATWKENINQSTKYVFLAAGSSLKGQSDMKKFEKARMLKDHIDRIRRDYERELTDKLMATRQRATAMYLIDKFALRAGNEKGDDEADTVGCCSLRYEHLTLQPPATVTFDFLGKDSIRFYNTFEVADQVFKNLQIFKKDPKSVGDMIFDRISTSTLNKHLSDQMSGLTAKVFRTYNASITFERELAKNTSQFENATMAEKIYAYNKANREVAVLCNHQKTVSKTHQASMAKAFDKIKGMKYQRRRLRHQLFKTEEFDKKKFKEFLKDESDLDEEWMEEHEKDLEVKEVEKINKRFEKEKASAIEKGEADKLLLLDAKALASRLKEVEGLAKKLAAERKSGNAKDGPVKSGRAEAIVAAIGKIDERIEAAKTQSRDKDEGKETSLGTSKTNYLDPRLTFAWCAKYGVPVEKMFPKTLREKFTWAAATPADWTF